MPRMCSSLSMAKPVARMRASSRRKAAGVARVWGVTRSKTVRRMMPSSSGSGQPGGEGLAHGRAIDRPSGPDLLDDAHGPLGLALGHDGHNAVPENRQAGAFARAAAQLVQIGHGDLGQLLLGPGAPGEPEELGGEGVGPGVPVLEEISEIDERPEEMMGGAPGQGGLAGDLGERRRAVDGGNGLDDPQPAIERLVGNVRLHGTVCCFIIPNRLRNFIS